MEMAHNDFKMVLKYLYSILGIIPILIKIEKHDIANEYQTIFKDD